MAIPPVPLQNLHRSCHYFHQDKYKLYTTTFLISASLRVCAPRSWLPTFLQFYQCNSLGAGFCPVSLQVPITLHGVS